MDIGMKYCSGCRVRNGNSAFSDTYLKLISYLKEKGAVWVSGSKTYDYLFLLCGCSCRCTSEDGCKVLKKVYKIDRTITEEQFTEIHQELEQGT